MRILFQGDSITDAFRKPDEINPAFRLGNGYVFLVASRLGARHPERNLVFINHGISGNTVQHLAARWQTDALDQEPDVLSLHIGVNNIIGRQNGTTDLSDGDLLDCYHRLLDQLRDRNPAIRFILLEPFLLEAGEVTSDWKVALRPIQNGIAAIAQEFGVPFISLQRIFDEALDRAPAIYWAYDGIHPTHAGFQLMADALLETAEKHRILD